MAQTRRKRGFQELGVVLHIFYIQLLQLIISSLNKSNFQLRLPKLGLISVE